MLSFIVFPAIQAWLLQTSGTQQRHPMPAWERSTRISHRQNVWGMSKTFPSGLSFSGRSVCRVSRCFPHRRGFSREYGTGKTAKVVKRKEGAACAGRRQAPEAIIIQGYPK